jgi:tetratricopeptide (TPR) repeat protein
MSPTHLLLQLVLALALAPGQAAPVPPRFDMIVRADFFAGFAGDADRLAHGMATCEEELARNPGNAEALVWHGSGLAFQAGQAFDAGDMARGGVLWERGMDEMNRAVALAPDSVGVLIPRGATLLTASRNMPPAVGRPLIEQGLADYERVLAIQTPTFATLGDHPKGELLFGLAEGYARLGNQVKARQYFDRIVADAPKSGQAPRARAWLATGEVPAFDGLGCVGCHQ